MNKCPECGYTGCDRGRKACDTMLDESKTIIEKLKNIGELLAKEIEGLINVHGFAISKDHGNSNIGSVKYRIKNFREIK